MYIYKLIMPIIMQMDVMDKVSTKISSNCVCGVCVLCDQLTRPASSTRTLHDG